MNFLKLKIGLLFLLTITSTYVFGQNTGISDVTRTPDPSAVLDVYSTSKGVLVPRLTEEERTAIPSPATGLLVYQSNGTTPGFYYYTGTTWASIASGAGTQWTKEPNTNNIYYNVGKVGVGVINPSSSFASTSMVLKDRIEIRRVAPTTVAELIFTNTSGTGGGDFRIGSDGNDIYWQGGGGRSLQMGSYWTTVLSGDRQGGFPAFVNGNTTPNIGVLVRSSRDVSVPLAIQGNSGNQTANLTEWLNSAGTPVSVIDNAGNMGIGTAVFNSQNKEKLLVDAGVTESVTAISAKGNINSYFQTNIQNLSTGDQSSSDIVATANNGDESSNYINVGINGQNYKYQANNALALGEANDGYLLSSGQNFYIANNNATKNMVFLTGGTAAANEAMRITAGRNIGMGVIDPSEKLELTGNFRLNGAFKPGNNAGTAGQVLISQGAIAPPIWFTFTPTNDWALGGNAVGGVTNFGTTSNWDLPFITNGTERMRITAAGNVGIGITPTTDKLEVNGNVKITGVASGTRRLTFAGTTLGGGAGDPDGIIEVRPVAANEQQEMLFYLGNDNTTTYGPDRIRMVAEEIRFQNFNNASNTGSSLANAESETGVNTRMIISPAGNVGIGTTTFDGTNPEKLVVDAGETESVNAIYAKGSIDNYFQFNIRNLSTGTSASSDIVATASNGTETTNFINVGINGGGYVYQNGSPIETGKANDGYLLSAGNDLYIVNNNKSQDSPKSIIFTVGGTATTNEAMRITAAGERVGIATTTPAAKLDVGGDFKLGSTGSVLNGITKAALIRTDNTTFNNNSATRVMSVTTSFDITNANIITTPRTALPNGIAIAWTRPTGANAFEVGFVNVSTTARALGTVTFDFTFIR